MYQIFKNIISILALTILVSCGGQDDEKSSDKIIVGVSADNPPYEFIKDRQIVGLDIDIIKEVASSMNKKLVIKNIDFPGLLPALNTGNIDAVISAITVTEKRDLKVDFTIPYMSTVMSVISHKDNAFKSLGDLENKIIGVQTGTTWELYARDLSKQIEGLKIRSLSNNLVIIEELKAGNIDAVIMEEMQATTFKKNVNDLSSFNIEDTKGDFAIVTPNGSFLTEILSKAIQELNDNGKLDKIKSDWLK